MEWYDYIILALSFMMMAIVLLQESKDNITDAFSGEKSELFKSQKKRGFEQLLSYSTVTIAVLFVGMIIVANILR